jgi:Ankyrin repeats (3 copies)
VDDSIMNENAGQVAGGGEEGVVAAAAAAAVGAGAEDPIFADLENLTLEQLQSAVEARPDVVRATDAANGWTLLHHAVHRGWENDIGQYLLDAGPNAARTRARNGGPLPIHLVNSRTHPGVARCVAQTFPRALHLSYGPQEEGNVPFDCAIKNGAPVETVAILFLLRYEPARAAESPTWLNTMIFSVVKFGERFYAMDQHLRQFCEKKTAQDGERALFLALVTHADLSVVRFIDWAWPASIQARCGKGRNPLHFAVLGDVSHEVVTHLVKCRPEAARERDDKGCLPIHYVRSFTTRWPDRTAPSWPDAAQALVMVWPESLQQMNNAGEIPLHGAAASNSLPLVQFLVEEYPEGVQHRSNDGSLPLHEAVRAAEPVGEQVVPYLVQQCPESVRETMNDGRTVLHLAAVGPGGPALVDLIVSHDPSLLRARATDGSLALHDAAKMFQDLATVRRLIELNPEALHATMYMGCTPLHLVAEHDDSQLAVSLARIMVEHAPDLVFSRAKYDRVPIHWAAEFGPFELVEFLAEFCPESIVCVEECGYTPLHCASMAQPPEVVRCLADRRPEALAIPDSLGQLPLHIAARAHLSLSSVEVLVEGWREALEVRNTLGHLPLHVAVVREDPPLEIVQYLAKASPGALRVRDTSGALPVELAAQRDAPLDVIFVLLKTWPVCLLPRRDSVPVQVKGRPLRHLRRRLNRLRDKVIALVDKVIRR